MEHLSLEALSRIVDEQPSSEDEAHLVACERCRAELTALREQTDALGRLPDLRPPLGDWQALEARMISDGLVRRRTLISGLAFTPAWMKVAAATLLFLSGTAVGVGFASNGPDDVAALEPVFEDLVAKVGTSDDAARLVRVTERQYMDALLRFRQFAEAESGRPLEGDPESRFAALEYLVLAGQAAVQQAPSDPFLNGVLASALAERQAVLRRISSGKTSNWF